MGTKMRLVCPNCSAQYEVDESVIPEAGRDVQCSSCGKTWWQTRSAEDTATITTMRDVAEDAAVDTADEDAPAPKPSGDGAEGKPGEAAGADTDAGADTPAKPTGDAARDEVEEVVAALVGGRSTAGAARSEGPESTRKSTDDRGPGAAPSARVRTELDDAVIDVLRQEAEREAKVRQSEPDKVETQPDLGIDSAGARDKVAQDRMAAARGLGEEAEADAEDSTLLAAARSRGAKLPDIEEINSTLSGREKTSPRPPVDSTQTLRRRRRGFRTGFTLMILAAAAAGVAYIYADRIVDAAPTLAPGMESYVQMVDAARVWLNSAALNATEAIRGLTEGQ